MGKAKAPKSPDPKETSAASTSTNIGTAVANSFLNNYNQVTPDGTLNYDQTGTYDWTDPYTGKTYQVPRFTATTTLSGQQQAIKDQNDAANLNLATLGNKLSGTLGQQLTGNFTIGNEATEARLFDLGSKRLDPQFARQEEALRTRLLNSGIREGSDAWNAEMTRNDQSRNDAYNQLLLSGRGQAVQEQLAEDNQRINQISALLNGGQVSQPNFINTGQQNIATTDTAGIIQQDYANRMNAYNQQQQSLGGLFSGIGSGIGAFLGLSDDDEKKNKERHGKVDGKMGLWSFNYKDEPAGAPKRIGLMASEVEKEKPSAVIRKGGKRYVDYGKALGLMGYK